MGLFLKEGFTLSNEGMKFNDLSDSAKDVAIKAFIPYYVDQFQHDNLEIIASKANNSDMITINQVLIENKFMDKKKLVDLSYQMSKPLYAVVLGALDDQSYDESGQPKEEWAKLWSQDEQELPQED